LPVTTNRIEIGRLCSLGEVKGFPQTRRRQAGRS
jgi:hypothetical protein